MTVIGSAYVNIRAITDKLESDVRKAVESINETIKVDVDVSSATAKIAALTSTIQDQVMSVSADTSRAMADIANIEHLSSQTVTVLANTLPAREEFSDMVDDMEDRPVNTVVTLNDTLARTQLAFLTRTRNVRVNLKANEAAFKAVGGFFARLSGVRVVADDLGKMVKHFANIDKMVPGIAKASTLIGSIGAAALSSVGGLSTLGASLGSIITMTAVAAPGMATGFVVGIGTLIVALRDFGKQLPEVTSLYKTLGATIKGNYWDVARNAIRDMSLTLFPQFQSGLAQTARALGGWSVALADALRVNLDGQVLSAMFGNLSKSIDIAGGAMKPLVRAFVELGYVGGEYLPRLAQWFVDVSNKFGDFIALAADTGDIYRWIDRGILNLKLLGRTIMEISGVFAGITEAARLAGSDGLATMLSFFSRMNDAIRSPDGMKSLSTIFAGANAASSALGDAFFEIFGALGNAAPSIKSAFESVAGVIGSLSGAISSIISNPEFQAGFEQMFNGIEAGFGKLAPVIGTMGPKMGAFLSIIGSLAENIGGILAAAFEVALPTITALKEALDPLIPVLGDALIQVIYALQPAFEALTEALVSMAPGITEVVKAAAPFVADFIEAIAPALPAIVAAILAGAAAFKVMAAAQQGMLILSNIAGLLGKTTLAQKLLNVAMRLNPIGLIVTAIVALGAGLVVAYNNVGWFRDGVDAAVKWIQEAFDGFLAFWNDNIIPMWEGAAKGAGEFFDGIGRWVGEAITNIQNFFGGFGKGAGDAQAAVGGFFDGIGGAISDFVGGVGEWFAGIGQGIGDAFNGAVGFVSDVISNISSVVSSSVESVISTWTAGWQIVSDTFMNIWNGIVWFFQPLVDLIAAIIKGGLDIMVAVWTGIWDIVAAVFYGIWINLVRFFTPIIQGIQDTIASTMTNISIAWQIMWQLIVDFFTGIWNGIVAFVTPIMQGISNTITSIVNGISAVWNAVWQGISTFFIGVWNNMVAFFSPIIAVIRAVIIGVTSSIAAGWNATWAGISNFFSGIWNGITAFVSGAINNIRAVVIGVTLAISSGWNSTWSSISRFVSSTWSGIVSAVSGFVNSVRQNVQNALDAIGRIGADILRNVGNFGSLLISAGRDLINGLTSGITANAGAVVEKIKSIAAGALDAVKSFFGIKSPSRVMRDEVGKQIGAGLALGIQQSIGAVKKATDKLAEAAVPDIADIMLPAIKSTPAVSQSDYRSVRVNPLSPSNVLRTTVRQDVTQNSLAAASAVGGVNVIVNPSAAMDEIAIGRAAVRELNWQLISG